jgi:N-acetylmuramoyl-L-alanine amidase
MRPFSVPAHWHPRPSPNHSPRAARVTAIVLHADAASKIESSLDWVRRPESRVSYHVMVSRLGTVFSVVHPDRTAWHAGESHFAGERFVNRFSVGVAFANRNDGVEPFPPVQQSAAADVCARLCQHYGIPVSRITTHAAIAPGRKTDPVGLDLAAFQALVAARLTAPPQAA